MESRQRGLACNLIGCDMRSWALVRSKSKWLTNTRFLPDILGKLGSLVGHPTVLSHETHRFNCGALCRRILFGTTELLQEPGQRTISGRFLRRVLGC